MVIFDNFMCRKKIRKMRKYIKWLFVLAWMILIFLFSNESGVESTETSHFFVEKVGTFFVYFIPRISFNFITLFVRKAAHFFLYFILGLLIGNATYNSKKWRVLSLLLCLLYACTDEFHQLFVSGRSGHILDVFVDFLGSSVGVYIYHWFTRKKVV